MKNIQIIFTILILSKLSFEQEIVGGLVDKQEDTCQEPLLNFLQQFGYGETVNFPFEISKCQSQVVAGINYEIHLIIYGQNCQLTLFKSLEGEVSLSDRAENNCFEFEQEGIEDEIEAEIEKEAEEALEEEEEEEKEEVESQN